MRSGLTKKQKQTSICFDEQSDWVEIKTHNTDLKRRLTRFAEMYPEVCWMISSNEHDERTFSIQKGRISFRLTAPYSDERCRKSSAYAKEHGITTRTSLEK